MRTRRTIQKRLILESLVTLPHPTADEVWQAITAVTPHISRTTIYRNLNKLVDEGKLKSITIDQAGAHFDYVTMPHNHFYCQSCGKLSDLPYKELDLSGFEKHLEGMQVTGSEILVRGICPACQAELAQEQVDQAATTEV